QMPARSTFTLPVFANIRAVASTCSSVSALQGPAMINGDSPVSIQDFSGSMVSKSFMLFWGIDGLSCFFILVYFSYVPRSDLVVLSVFAHDIEINGMFQYLADCRIVVGRIAPFHINIKFIF